jgi:hypothetical protein
MEPDNPIDGSFSVDEILAATQLTVHPDNFVLVGLSPHEKLPTLAALPNDFYQIIVEPDVLTLLLKGRDWAGLAPAYPTAQTEGPLRLFTFSVAMDWDVVGFLAAVTSLLAANGIPLGAVCGYYRDHLFIAETHAGRAEFLLRAEIDRCKKGQNKNTLSN